MLHTKDCGRAIFERFISMEDRHLQMLLAATGDYAGGIDGAFGPVLVDRNLAEVADLVRIRNSLLLVPPVQLEELVAGFVE